MLLPIMQALAPCHLWQVAGGSTGLSLAALSMDESNIDPWPKKEKSSGYHTNPRFSKRLLGVSKILCK